MKILSNLKVVKAKQDEDLKYPELDFNNIKKRLEKILEPIIKRLAYDKLKIDIRYVTKWGSAIIVDINCLDLRTNEYIEDIFGAEATILTHTKLSEIAKLFPKGSSVTNDDKIFVSLPTIK